MLVMVLDLGRKVRRKRRNRSGKRRRWTRTTRRRRRWSSRRRWKRATRKSRSRSKRKKRRRLEGGGV